MTSRSDLFSTPPEQTLAATHRAEWGRLLSLLVARTRRLDLVEDALGEAFARAAARWPVDGVPANPVGWLYTTAHRQVVGRIRAEATAGRNAPLLAVRPGWLRPDEPDDGLADERLQLILLCCHPALPRESQPALALRLVIGTPTEQIARLFLVPTSTMAARLTRAKKKIVAAGIPLGAPVSDELTVRLDEVCRTIYLAFTAAYTPGAGPDLLRADLAGDAVHLATVLHQVVPSAPQAQALRALLILQHSRRDARLRNGRLVTLADQDRTAWHQDEIDLGLELAGTLEPGHAYAEQLRLQALIAAAHASAPHAGDTDWAAIADRYEALETLTGSAIVRLNRAVAVAEAQNPQAGLALLAGVHDLLHDHYRFAAVCGELARRVGDHDLAIASYRASIELCGNEVERAHLRARLAAIQLP
ncbi:MAG: RNA polymerase sigma factor [Acidimicrobiales bacterium]